MGVAGLGVQRVRDDDRAVQAAEYVCDAVEEWVNAGIPFNFAAIWTWARTTPVPVADSWCTWDPSDCRDPRSTLPSMAITRRR